MIIQHWLIPTKKNKYHPIALRPLGLMVFLTLFVTIPFLYNVTSAKQMQVLGYATNISVSDLNSLSNQERTNAGLAPLVLNGQLNSAAAAKAADMFAKDYWAHVAPDGTTPWSFIYAAGYNYSVAGENLAKGFNTSSGVVAGWMASQLHKDNVLNTSYQDVGYAAVNGVLQGSETTLVVAMYGSKAAVAPAPAPTPAAIAPTPPSTPVATEPTSQPSEPVTTPTTTTQPAESQPSTKPTAPVATTKDNTALTNSSGVVEGANIILQPIKTYQAFNWGQKASIALAFTMLLLFIMKHTLIWRAQKRGVKHIWLRSHPIGQASLLIVTLVLTISSGAGSIL